MYTQEDRLVALEQKVAALERQVFARQAEQGRAISDVQHELTILLGMATREIELTNGLRADVEDVKSDVRGLKEDVANIEVHLVQQDQRSVRVDQRSDQQDQRLVRIEMLLAEVLARLPEKPM